MDLSDPQVQDDNMTKKSRQSALSAEILNYLAIPAEPFAEWVKFFTIYDINGKLLYINKMLNHNWLKMLVELK